MKNKGFSLVELIVVIAIMAILVGVAVPVYTSYIEKAQKSKDEQMVGEIKHAIEIAAVGESWYTQMPEGGVAMIVITGEGTTVKTSGTAGVGDLSALVTTALSNTFGDYGSMKLSYDGWTGTLNATTDENGVAGGTAVSIAQSAYANNVEGLLGAVQNVTSLFSQVVAENEQLVPDYISSDLKLNASDSTQVANGMLLYVAEKTNVDADAFAEAWITGDFSDSSLGMDIYTRKAAEYAYVQAMTELTGCETLKALFAAYNQPDEDGNFQGADPVADVYTTHAPSCTTCSTAIGELVEYDDAGNADFSNLQKEAYAYLDILNQVEQSKSVVLENINESNLYTDSPLVQYVKAYVSVASLMSQNGVEDGDVVIVVSMDAKGNVTADIYPWEY